MTVSVAGFMQIGERWVNSYDVSTVEPRHDKRGAEIHMSNSKIVYVAESPGQVIEMIAEAREENEGR